MRRKIRRHVTHQFTLARIPSFCFFLTLFLSFSVIYLSIYYSFLPEDSFLQDHRSRSSHVPGGIHQRLIFALGILENMTNGSLSVAPREFRQRLGKEQGTGKKMELRKRREGRSRGRNETLRSLNSKSYLNAIPLIQTCNGLQG